VEECASGAAERCAAGGRFWLWLGLGYKFIAATAPHPSTTTTSTHTLAHTQQTTSIEMSATGFEVWCLIEGDTTPFPVTASSYYVSIGELKRGIKKETENTFKMVDARNLILWKVCHFQRFVLTLSVTPL
jgi:hypothetical protein